MIRQPSKIRKVMIGCLIKADPTADRGNDVDQDEAINFASFIVFLVFIEFYGSLHLLTRKFSPSRRRRIFREL